MEYPIFSPPKDLAKKDPREWSKVEAGNYSKWFLSVLGSRVDNLLKYLSLVEDEQDVILLSKAQEKCELILKTEKLKFFSPTDRKLTNQGYALAADLGLLVATLLIKRGHGMVKWTVLKKPKTDQSYNLPVLVGFGTDHLDPVGGSIGDLAWLARGNHKPHAWTKTLEFWSARIG